MDIQHIRKVVDNAILHKVDYAKIPLDDLRQLLELAEQAQAKAVEDTIVGKIDGQEKYMILNGQNRGDILWNSIGAEKEFGKQASPFGDSDSIAKEIFSKVDNTIYEYGGRQSEKCGRECISIIKESMDKVRIDTLNEGIEAIEDKLRKADTMEVEGFIRSQIILERLKKKK